MEDILDVYEMPYNPAISVVCMDEKPYQLLGEVRDSWAMRPGDDKRWILNIAATERAASLPLSNHLEECTM